MKWALDFTGAAERNLLHIWIYLADHDPAVAERITERLRLRCRLLRSFREAGVLTPDIASSARALIEPPYLIVHRIGPDAVQIVRVIHGARDMPGLGISDFAD